MNAASSWERDGRDWPNRAASRFVDAGGLRWHVQLLGSGPALLLLHGTGAATHTWRDLAPLLAQQFTVVAPDLPGHGFTDAPADYRLTLPVMAAAVRGLIATLEVHPSIAVGHSAGAAILARMSLDGALPLEALVSLNGALLPLRGVAGQLFSPAAKLLAGNSLVPRLLAWRAGDRDAVERLIASTGSRLDVRGVEYYARLVRSPEHVRGALAMMANWDLAPLARELPRLVPPLTLVVGANDRTVDPGEAQQVRQRVAGAKVVVQPHAGHLAHEEYPRATAELIGAVADAGRKLAPAAMG